MIFHLSGLLPNYNSCKFILFSFPKHLFKHNIIVAKEKSIALEDIM